MSFLINEEYKDDVQAIMEHEEAPVINDRYKKAVTAKLVENQMKFLKESSDQANVTGSAINNWEPVLVSMVRRAMPKVMAFDVAGVQPMTGPTGLIFAMRARYTSQTGTEALHNEANSGFSGTGTQAGDTSGFDRGHFQADDGATAADEADPTTSTSAGNAMTRSAGETLGTTSGGAWAEMAFSIEKTSVEAKTRALKAEYSRELQTDLKAIHGMDAEAELGTILSTEITAEIDREFLRTLNISAALGAGDKTVANRFNLAADTDGRWMVDRWKGLAFQIELEANAVAVATRRGKGNFVICSANVASALSMVGLLTDTPKFSAGLNVDVTGSTYAGVLNGRLKVYIDPYATVDYITVGYRGSNAWDAGIYYCPYVPLEMFRAIGEDSFQPKIGFKTRYGIVANPFAALVGGATINAQKAGKGLGQGENPYFRKFQVTNLDGLA